MSQNVRKSDVKKTRICSICEHSDPLGLKLTALGGSDIGSEFTEVPVYPIFNAHKPQNISTFCMAYSLKYYFQIEFHFKTFDKTSKLSI